MKWLACAVVVVAACGKHDDVQHPAAPMRLDTPGPIAAPPPTPVPAAPAPIDWDRDLTYLPVDSELVLGVDLVQLRAHTMWKEYAPALLAKAHAKLATFEARCGFAPFDTLTGFAIGLKDLGGSAARGVFVIHGVPRAAITTCIAKTPGAKVDGDVLEVHESYSDLFATFLTDTTALVVTGPGVTRAELDAARIGQSALLTSPAFLDMWKLVDRHGSGWVLANGNMPALSSVRGIAPDLKAIFGSITIGGGLALDARFRLGSTQTVATLTGILKGQLQQLGQYFDRLDVTADSTDVHLQVAMTADQLDQIASMLQTPLVHRDAKGH